jgi:hypothetical protein
MHVNGRLTAPPEVLAVLVTNSVFATLPEGGTFEPQALGTTRVFFNVSMWLRGLRVAMRFCLEMLGPVTAAHRLSAPMEAAARG